MGKQNALRELLGVTQREIAMILGISESNWAMYETGRRPPPKHAMELFAGFLQHVESIPKKQTDDFNPELRKILDKLVRENEFQRMRLERKIAASDQKLEIMRRRAQLEIFLKNNPEAKITPFAVDALNNKKYRKKEKDVQERLLMEREQAILAFEQQWLATRMEVK